MHLNTIYMYLILSNMQCFTIMSMITRSLSAANSWKLQADACKATQTSPSAGWICYNALEANPTKCQGISFKGNKQVDDFKISVNGHDIEFSKSMTSLGICVEYTLTFDSHINDLCLKASRQRSALQRLSSLLDYPSRRAIYNSLISIYFSQVGLVSLKCLKKN